MADFRLANDLFGSIKLKEQFTRAVVRGKDKIGDREVYVVSATELDGKQDRLFFDAEMGLLLRRVIYIATMVGVVPKQIDF